MTEWRRTLRSWPKEESRVADAASLPASLQDAAWLREVRRETTNGAALAIAAGSLLPIGLGFALAAWLAGQKHDLAAVLAAFSGMGLGMAGLFPAAKKAEAWQADRRRRRVLGLLEARGETTLGGEFVTMAYGDRLWHHPGLGHDADEGVMTLDFDRLVYVGRATRFEIPKAAILGTEIRFFDSAMTGPLPRLYVAYAREEGVGSLGVALPYRRSAGRRVQAIEELRGRLESWRTERLPISAVGSFARPLRGDYRIAKPKREPGLPATALAGVATVLLLGAIEFAMTFLSIRMGWRRMGYGLFVLIASASTVWTLFARAIETRLPERWRRKEVDEVRDALRGVDDPSAEEPLSDARLRQ